MSGVVHRFCVSSSSPPLTLPQATPTPMRIIPKHSQISPMVLHHTGPGAPNRSRIPWAFTESANMHRVPFSTTERRRLRCVGSRGGELGSGWRSRRGFEGE